MNLDEFRRLTDDLPGDTEIIIASDPEGNSCNVVTAYSENLALEIPEYGDVYTIHPDDLEDHHPDTLHKLFILWP